MKTRREQWVRIGKVDVNPDNVLAVKIAQAGAKTEQPRDALQDYFDKCCPVRPVNEPSVLDAAQAKRLRRAQKRLREQT